MFSELIPLGSKMDLRSVGHNSRNWEQEEARTYPSQVYDIIEEDRIEIAMPMHGTKLVLLPVDTDYDAIFYTKATLYECFVHIIDRYKKDNAYLLLVQLTSNLRKYQRREYYRFSCSLEMEQRPLEEEETKAIEGAQGDSFLIPGLPLKQSMIEDISGGGLRFVSSQEYEPGSLIYCTYHLLTDKIDKTCSVVGKVLAVERKDDGVYEHRVQYVNLDTADREQIIKYIFEQERASRKKQVAWENGERA